MFFSDIIKPVGIYFVISYVVLDIISMIFEKGIAHYCKDMSLPIYILTTPFVNLFGDIVRPFVETVIAFIEIIAYVRHRRFGFFIKKIMMGILYIPLVIYIIINFISIFDNSHS